jgi:hypothetical protein
MSLFYFRINRCVTVTKTTKAHSLRLVFSGLSSAGSASNFDLKPLPCSAFRSRQMAEPQNRLVRRGAHPRSSPANHRSAFLLRCSYYPQQRSSESSSRVFRHPICPLALEAARSKHEATLRGRFQRNTASLPAEALHQRRRTPQEHWHASCSPRHPCSPESPSRVVRGATAIASALFSGRMPG